MNRKTNYPKAKNITKLTDLQINDKILWVSLSVPNEVIVSISEKGKSRGALGIQDFYLKFPNNSVPQYMDRAGIIRRGKLLSKEEYPEFYL
jgi:hypothetical protein